MATFQACPQKYKYQFVDRLHRVDTQDTGLPRTFGAALHAGLEAYYQGGMPRVMEQAFLAAYPLTIPLTEHLYTVANGIEVLLQYPAFAQANEAGWKLLECETRRELAIEGLPDAYELKPDAIFETPMGIIGMDTKSTQKSLTGLYWGQFDHSDQLSGYWRYIQRTYGDCAGFYVNVIQLGHRSRMYKGEPAGFWVKFERQRFERTEAQLLTWEANVRTWNQRIKRALHLEEWGRVRSMCQWCEYADLCLSGGDAQVQVALYETVDPTAYLKGEAQ